MAVPPPLPDPTHIEMRLLIVTEMLDKAIVELRRVTEEVKTAGPDGPATPDDGSTDDDDRPSLA